jgi:hypothetical protein
MPCGMQFLGGGGGGFGSSGCDFVECGLTGNGFINNPNGSSSGRGFWCGFVFHYFCGGPLDLQELRDHLENDERLYNNTLPYFNDPSRGKGTFGARMAEVNQYAFVNRMIDMVQLGNFPSSAIPGLGDELFGKTQDQIADLLSQARASNMSEIDRLFHEPF